MSVAMKKTSSGASTQLIICLRPPTRVMVATLGRPLETRPHFGIPEMPYNSCDLAVRRPVGASCRRLD